MTGEKITVGAPFFNLTCGALLLTACFVVPFGFSLAWKRGDLLAVAQRLTLALVAGAVTAVLASAWLSGGSVFAPLAAGLAIFVIFGTLIEVAMRARRPGLAPAVALKRALGMPLSFYGGALAHIGVGVTLLGLSGLGFGAETIATLHKGVPERIGPYSITLDWVGERVGPNYKEAATSMTVRSGGEVVAEIEPARRQFAARQMTTTQAGLATLNFGQVYVAVADPTPEGDVPARLYWKPLVTLIWLGAGAMAFGGVLSLADRRLRIRRRGAREGRRRLAGATRTMIMRIIRFALFVALALGSAPASAVQPDEVMKDPALEARARTLSEELRCLVCQNQSIDDSDAPLARDIRILIRQPHRRRRKQRGGAGVSRLALRRLHSAQAAVQARDHAPVAEPGAGPRRRPGGGALRSPPRATVDAALKRRGRDAACGVDRRRRCWWLTFDACGLGGGRARAPSDAPRWPLR